jgi:hypothetical protein
VSRLPCSPCTRRGETRQHAAAKSLYRAKLSPDRPSRHTRDGGGVVGRSHTVTAAAHAVRIQIHAALQGPRVNVNPAATVFPLHCSFFFSLRFGILFIIRVHLVDEYVISSGCCFWKEGREAKPVALRCVACECVDKGGAFRWMEMDASLDPAAMRARALVRPAAPSAQLHRRTRPPCMHPGGQARSSRSSLGLAAASQQYFSLRTNQPPATSQQYFSLRTNQHQPSGTSQTNRLHIPWRARLLFFLRG